MADKTTERPREVYMSMYGKITRHCTDDASSRLFSSIFSVCPRVGRRQLRSIINFCSALPQFSRLSLSRVWTKPARMRIFVHNNNRLLFGLGGWWSASFLLEFWIKGMGAMVGAGGGPCMNIGLSNLDMKELTEDVLTHTPQMDRQRIPKDWMTK